MEADLWEVALCHLQHVVGVGEEDVAPVAVDGNKLMFALLERCKCFGIVAFDPACLV